MSEDTILKAYARGYAAGRKERPVVTWQERHDRFFQTALNGLLANTKGWAKNINGVQVSDKSPEDFAVTAKLIADAAMKVQR